MLSSKTSQKNFIYWIIRKLKKNLKKDTRFYSCILFKYSRVYYGVYKLLSKKNPNKNSSVTCNT